MFQKCFMLVSKAKCESNSTSRWSTAVRPCIRRYNRGRWRFSAAQLRLNINPTHNMYIMYSNVQHTAFNIFYNIFTCLPVIGATLSAEISHGLFNLFHSISIVSIPIKIIGLNFQRRKTDRVWNSDAEQHWFYVENHEVSGATRNCQVKKWTNFLRAWNRRDANVSTVVVI